MGAEIFNGLVFIVEYAQFFGNLTIIQIGLPMKFENLAHLGGKAAISFSISSSICFFLTRYSLLYSFFLI